MKGNRFYLVLLILCLTISLGLVGCKTTSPPGEGAASPAEARQAIEKELMEKPFVIGVEDSVSVYVRDNPEISREYVVGAEGMIFMALVGDIQAAGLTKPELQKSLTEKLSKFIINPDISVGVSQYRSKRVYVIGEVTLPGPVPMKGNILTVWDAIVVAGFPLKTAALWRVHVITPDVANPVVKRINLRSIMYRGQFANNDFLKSGDIVVVPSSTAASLGTYLGQVVSPAYSARGLVEVYDFFKNKQYFLNPLYGRFGAPAPSP